MVIHRPSLISREEEDDDGSSIPSSMEFVDNVRKYARLLNAIPVNPDSKAGGRFSVSGSFDVVPLGKVIEGVVKSAVERDTEGLKFLHHLGGIDLKLGDVRSWLPRNGDDASVEEIELGEWTRRAVELGMHSTIEGRIHFRKGIGVLRRLCLF